MNKKKAIELTRFEAAEYIDQSVLKPEFNEEEIRMYIQEGIDFGCKTVCVNPTSLDIAAELTKGTKTKICVTCDFPFGLSPTEVKVLQAKYYVEHYDVFELDMVANYGWIRSARWDLYEADIKAVTEICHKHGTAVKVILETDALTLEEVHQACTIAAQVGVDFVKTSTGFFVSARNDGATIEVLKVMLDAVNGKCKVKASGGIRTRERFLDFIDLGVDRMGIGYKSTGTVLNTTIDAVRKEK